MTEHVLHLKSPPIVEAVLDIQCDLPPGFDLAALEEDARAAFRDQYPKFANECADAGWDGFDAAPINLEAVHNAVAFIRALPGLLPLPEFAPEPDGAVSLDWIVSRNRVFSVSAGASGRLAYAWLDGADRGHAVARFDGTTIPARILDGIRAIATYGHSSVQPR